MNKYEKKLLEWLENNSIMLGFIAIFFLGMVLRFILRIYVSNDAEAFLLPWYNTIKKNGGISSLGQQVGDYNILYQFLIALFTYLPFEPLSDYKLLSVIFDVLLAGAGGIWVWKLTKNRLQTFAAFTGIFMSPMVVLNSSCWGQCDSIYVFFCFLTFVMLLKERYNMAFCMYGIAFAFKLQAVFLLPFLLLYYVRSKKFSGLKFLYIPVMMILSGFPALIHGRKVSEIFNIYGQQVHQYDDRLVLNYPNFWNFFYNSEYFSQYTDMLSGAAVVVTVSILGIMVVWAINRNVQMTVQNSLWLAFLMAYTCVLFLPSMHERYAYLCEILALLIAVIDKKTIVLLIPMYLCSLAVYTYYLFWMSYDVKGITVLNLLVFLAYCIYFGYRQRQSAKQ